MFDKRRRIMAKVNVGVVGATGMVGQTIIRVLEERDFPVAELIPFASARSAGNNIEFQNQEFKVQELTENSFAENEIDVLFLAGGGAVSEIYAPLAVEKGIRVIDNSSFFRMNDEIPLVIPEVNADSITEEDYLVSNPNCSTIQSLVVLKPLEDAYGIERVVFNTYQAVSGSGHAGVRDLEEGTTDNYKYSISNNVLPQIDSFTENGYTKEEMKMVDETHKILDNDDVRVTATAVRVPIMNTHAVSINVELKEDFEINEVVKILNEAPGIIVIDDTEQEEYPLNELADGRDEVFVGRIRRDFSVDNGINLWCVADNIRKGAATNTVQIAEYVLEKFIGK